MRDAYHRNLLMLSIGGLTLLAWAALWWLDGSPWGALFHAHAHGAGHAHHVGNTSGLGGTAVVFVAGWVLMTVAMMLPTTLPLVGVFQRLTRARTDQSGLIALLLSGYLFAWTLFGSVAWGLNVGIAAAAPVTAARWSWTTGAALFLLAGAFQFSRLKYQCLDKCRTPLSFAMSHWRGLAPRYEAFRMGLAHGAYCVGCCWALMLLMFAVGTASVLWMLVLAVLMAIEKNVSWGRRFAGPLGAVLLAVGIGSIVYHIDLAGL